jgi:photosystem II stability/assembly factor-like uncharacterized protein
MLNDLSERTREHLQRLEQFMSFINRRTKSPRVVIIAIAILFNSAALSACSIPGRYNGGPSSLNTLRRSPDVGRPGKPDTSVEDRVKRDIAQIPAYFEPAGLAHSGGEFVCRGASYSLFIKPAETDLVLQSAAQPKPSGQPNGGSDSSTLDIPRPVSTERTVLIRMRIEGGSRACRPVGRDPLPTKTNYFIGNDPARWRTNVPTFARVRKDSIYPGIDQVFYGNQQKIEYDFVVHPGANPDRIRTTFDGMTRMRVDRGDLVLSTPAGDLRQPKPVAYQETAGIRTEVAAKYELKGKHRVGIKLGRYDRTRQVTIDPTIIYSTLFGTGLSAAYGIAVDSAGNAYVTGIAKANTFAPTQGAFSAGSGDTVITYVSKLDPSGKTVIYSAMLGATAQGDSGSSIGYGIAVDAAGNAYVSGETISQSFPVTAGAFQTSNHSQDASVRSSGFVFKLNPTGSSLEYSTYVGGSGRTSALAVAADSSGSAYVTGATTATDFPTTAGAFQATKTAFSSCFVTKLNPGGTGLAYSTFLGGSGQGSQIGSGIAVDAAGNAYVTGITYASDFPTTPGAFETVKADNSPTHEITFVSKLNATGAGLAYSTFLGRRSSGSGIAVDSQGSAYVTGIDYGAVSIPVGPFAISSDGGATWKAASNGLPDKYMLTPPVLDPSNPATVYAALENDGLFKTTDRGGSWTKLNGGLPAGPYFVSSIAVDPVNTAVVYAGVSPGLPPGISGTAPIPGVYRSSDGGNVWTHMSSEPDGFALTIDPHTTSTIYAVKDGVGPIKSIDSGSTWTLIASGLSQGFGVSALAIDPENPSTLYLSGITKSGSGIFKTQDGGQSWTQIENQAPATSFAVDPTNGSIVYALLSIDDSADSGSGHLNPHRHIANLSAPLAGVIKSVDGGGNWSSAIKGIPNLPALYRLSIDPLSTSTVYLGTADGVYRTEDGGQNWSIIPGLGPADAFGVLPDTKTEGIIYVGGSMSDYPPPHLFVDKLSPDGSALSYSNFIVGNHAEGGYGIALDGNGNAYVTGSTSSSDFPTIGAFQASLAGGAANGFILKLDGDGKLAFSSFLGGSQADSSRAIAVDGTGNILVAGVAYSTDFPLVAAIQTRFPSPHGGITPFSATITKITAPGAAPKVMSAQKQGKTLWVYGTGFAAGAVIITDGDHLNTVNDSQNPDSTLMSKKGGKKIKPGQAASIQVMNPDGTMSNTISFTPSN